MDKINAYRKIIKDIFTLYAETRIPVNHPNPGYQLIFDEARDSYLLYRTGWKEDIRRVHFCVFHVDIKDDKVWVQEDATDFDLVGELEEKGIPKQDIVLGFHAPYKRPYSGYAVS
ncbi:MAG TPA: XisI protein [Saprospiraceae bacterium]|nr:XisI protein [Saprospiraceae bacterium]HMQ81583.1 XisI protein [Saprospiraceae bacterium]